MLEVKIRKPKKKSVKIKLREVKSKPYATGGGPAIPQKNIEKLSSIEEQIRSLNPLAFSGATSEFDNDCVDIDYVDNENNIMVNIGCRVLFICMNCKSLKKLLLLDYLQFTDEILQDGPEKNSAVNIMTDFDNIFDNDASKNW